jgi:hypothetical protein
MLPSQSLHFLDGHEFDASHASYKQFSEDEGCGGDVSHAASDRSSRLLSVSVTFLVVSVALHTQVFVASENVVMLGSCSGGCMPMSQLSVH